MEEEVDKVPRLPINRYRTKLSKAIAQIHERYEDLGLKNASRRDPVDRKRELGYFLENKLVVFQVIDKPELLKELDLDALVTNKLTVEGKTIISLQEILFWMDSNILATVLQQQLDEILLISEGSSPLEAHSLAIQTQNTQDREKIKQALKIQLDLESRGLVDKRRRVRVSRSGKQHISKIETLDELKTRLISKTITRIVWGDLRLELHKALVIELARETTKEVSELNHTDYKNHKLSILNGKSLTGFLNYWIKRNTLGKRTIRFILEEVGLVEKALSIKEIKTLEQLKNLLTSSAIRTIPWFELPLEFHKALVIELARVAKKEVSELIDEDYREYKLSILNERNLRGLLSYWSKRNTTDKTTTRLILEKLGFVEKALSIKEIKTLEQLKNLLTSGGIRRISWPELPLELHKALVIELARETKKEVYELIQTDYKNHKLSILNGRSLRDLLSYWRDRKTIDKRTTRFILEKLGLPEKAPNIKEKKSLFKDERKITSKYPGDEALKELIVKHKGNLRKIANDLIVRVVESTVLTWINENPELRKLAFEQRQLRKSRKRKVRSSSNPGKEILKALIFNYKGDLKEMAKNPNINTDVETLSSWIKEEGLESLVREWEEKLAGLID